jgi:hypothetical protein
MRVVNNYPQPFLIYPFARLVSGKQGYEWLLRRCAFPFLEGKMLSPIYHLQPSSEEEQK